MDEIQKKLDEVIEQEIEELSKFKSGSREKADAIDDLAKLYRLRIEETKNKQDHVDVCEARKEDALMKRDQFVEQVKDRYFKLGIAAAELVLPLAFYAVWMRKGFKFEESGTFTSTTFKGLFNKFKPTKK